MNWIRALLKRSIVRYLAVGGSVYALEVLVILFAQHLGASAVWAVGIGFWVGLVVSFLLQKFVTFGDKRMHRKILLPQIIAVALLVLFNFGFTIALTKLLAAHVPAVASRTAALLITTTWNFYLYRTRIFKSTDELIY